MGKKQVKSKTLRTYDKAKSNGTFNKQGRVFDEFKEDFFKEAWQDKQVRIRKELEEITKEQGGAKLSGAKWGLYLQGTLMQTYDDDDIGYREALDDLKTAYEETGVHHEIKVVPPKISDVQKYKPKPIEREAIKLTKDNLIEVMKFINRPFVLNTQKAKDKFEVFERGVERFGVQVDTIQGLAVAHIGDFIVKNQKGRLEVLESDTFNLNFILSDEAELTTKEIKERIAERVEALKEKDEEGAITELQLLGLWIDGDF